MKTELRCSLIALIASGDMPAFFSDLIVEEQDVEEEQETEEISEQEEVDYGVEKVFGNEEIEAPQLPEY